MSLVKIEHNEIICIQNRVFGPFYTLCGGFSARRRLPRVIGERGIAGIRSPVRTVAEKRPHPDLRLAPWPMGIISLPSTQTTEDHTQCMTDQKVVGVRSSRPFDAAPPSREGQSGRTGLLDPGGTAMPRMTALHMLRSTITTVSAPASSSFRGSITHPTQPLCTLRVRRRPPPHATLATRRLARPYLGRTCTG